MRVVHIIKATRISGAERHLLMLLGGLQRCGIDVRLLLLVEPDTPMDHMIAEAEARHVPAERVLIRADYDLRIVKHLRDCLRDYQPDVVHTHLIHADVYGIPAARWAGVPVILSGRHNDDLFRYRLPVRWVNRILWGLATGGTIISHAIQRFVTRVEGAPHDKIRVVRYGIEHDSLSQEDIQSARRSLRQELNISDDALIVGSVCRLIEQKGLTYGIEAFARNVSFFPDAHLVIAGDGSLRQALEKLVRQSGIVDRVHFLGWRDDVPTIMTAMDVFLLPSLWEGFGLVLLEAMSRRVPIIASEVSAIPEIVLPGETGLLVAPRDVDGLSKAIYDLLRDRDLRLYLGLNGEDRLEQHFTVERMVTETIAVYEEFLHQKKANS